jgi:hypothetical protein
MHTFPQPRSPTGLPRARAGTFYAATAGNRDGSFTLTGNMEVFISGYRYEVLCLPGLLNPCNGLGFEQALPSVGAAIITWIGGIVLMVSAVMAFSAGLRLQQFADGDIAPLAPRTRGESTCFPSTVTINWLSEWRGAARRGVCGTSGRGGACKQMPRGESAT